MQGQRTPVNEQQALIFSVCTFRSLPEVNICDWGVIPQAPDTHNSCIP